MHLAIDPRALAVAVAVLCCGAASLLTSWHLSSHSLYTSTGSLSTEGSIVSRSDEYIA